MDDAKAVGDELTVAQLLSDSAVIAVLPRWLRIVATISRDTRSFKALHTSDLTQVIELHESRGAADVKQYIDRRLARDESLKDELDMQLSADEIAVAAESNFLVAASLLDAIKAQLSVTLPKDTRLSLHDAYEQDFERRFVTSIQSATTRCGAKSSCCLRSFWHPKPLLRSTTRRCGKR